VKEDDRDPSSGHGDGAEAGLLARARAGDRGAFEALTRAAFPALVGFCGTLERDPERALDLAQEALVKALQAIAAFRGEASFATWVRRIARNLFLNERSRARTRRERTGGDPEALDRNPASGAPLAPAEEPSAQALRGERAARVHDALAKLPEEQRTAVTLCDRDGLAYKEIAALMEAPIGTVMWRIHQGRKRLRELLRAELPDIEGRPA